MQEGLLDHFDGHALELYVADCSKHLGDPVCVAGVPYASGAIRSTQSFRYGYAEIKWNLTLLSGEHPSSDGTNWGDSSYHTFGVDWEPDRLTWCVDGVAQPRPITHHIPDVLMYLLATVQVGGTGFAGQPDEELEPIAAVAIDHIRVWRHCTGCECALVPVP